MRSLLQTSVVLFVAACSGAASTELFEGEPTPVSETSPSDPPANDEERPARPIEQTEDDAALPPKKDAGTTDAAKDAAKEADAPPPVVKCSFDSDCKGDAVCNWKTDTCSEPGALGDPCKRDVECAGGLCNWKVQECSEPAPAGAGCRRNKECASGDCTSGFCE